MVRGLQKVGTSKGIILTRDMIDHLGVTDSVEISLEAGRIVLTAPALDAVRSARRSTVREAAAEGINKYREALDVLAGKQDAL